MNFDDSLSLESRYIAPAIKIVDGVLDNSQELIDIAKSFPDMWRKSAVSGQQNIDTNIRRSGSFPFSVHFTSPTEFFVAAQKIFWQAQHYAREMGVGFSHMEPISMLEYASGNGFYKPHFDFGPDTPRVFSMVLYLNDVEEGGETYFDKLDVAVTPKAGRMAIFPATLPYSHEARLPISGNKYILVTWFGMDLDPAIFGKYYQ